LMQQQPNGAGDDLMDAKPSLLALTLTDTSGQMHSSPNAFEITW